MALVDRTALLVYCTASQRFLLKSPSPRNCQLYECRQTIGLFHIIKWTVSVGVDLSKKYWLAVYWCTSLIRNSPHLGPYSRAMPRALRCSWGGGGVSCERGTLVLLDPILSMATRARTRQPQVMTHTLQQVMTRTLQRLLLAPVCVHRVPRELPIGALGGVPREQKMLKGHLPRVIYHQVY